MFFFLKMKRGTVARPAGRDQRDPSMKRVAAVAEGSNNAY
jgi:hypothetical protein